ncbi:MAG: hypothetical protein GY838_15345 [bacterium]|nr:hypothetical protein [bacterium]
MRNPDARVTDAELEASLDRLGVQELEERMELSPLLADGGIGDTDRCSCACSCDWSPSDPGAPDLGDTGVLPQMDLPAGVR